MPTLATMEYVADLVVRRAISEAAAQGRPLREVLVERYPFQEDISCHQIWREALDRHGLQLITDVST